MTSSSKIKTELRIAIVTSTGGAVMNQLLGNSFFREQIIAVISDRNCAALEKGKFHGVDTHLFEETNTDAFCDRLLAFGLDQRIDYFILFYTKLITGKLLSVYENRIINLHPSLLPAYRGFKAVEKAIADGARYIGNTIHFIDKEADRGKIIIQSISPLNPHDTIPKIRHNVFVYQCRALLQVVRWLWEDRIHVEGHRVVIDNSTYDDFEFSPNIDFIDAISLRIPYPASGE